VVFLNVGLSEQLGYSDLLSSIVLGLVAMLVFRKPQKEWLEPIRHIEETIFLVFFVLAGSHFDPGVFTSALPLILLYVVSRFAGKYMGAWLGAAAVGAQPEIRRWVGLTLMPHAGVAIGLALRASEMPGVRTTGELLLNVVIGSTLFFELAGPWLAKLALERAGEIRRPAS
jgi:Kef-type K+ transport system membrane component KefB